MFALTMRFSVPEGADWDAIRKLAQSRAPIYAEMPHLISKAFVVDEAGRQYGGNYVWETREAVEAFVDSDGLRATITKLGWGEPTWTIMEVAAYVDRGRVITPAEAAS